MRSDPDKQPSHRRVPRSTPPAPDVNEPDPTAPEDEDYKVGRGRPPLHSRFKPGGTGGPGRPKGSKNRATLFREAFDTPRPVTVEGRRKRMTAQELGYRQLATQVAKGDRRAIELAEKIRSNLCGPEEAGETPVSPLSEAELAILRRTSDGSE